VVDPGAPVLSVPVRPISPDYLDRNDQTATHLILPVMPQPPAREGRAVDKAHRNYLLQVISGTESIVGKLIVG